MSNYEKYLNTYYGQDLLKNHKLTEKGYWKVYGEDPNPDFGGHHHEPEIGVYSGVLSDVIREAVEHPQFWQWGAGGRIKKTTIVKAKKVG